MCFKINSQKLREAKFNLILSIESGLKNDEVVPIDDSQLLRFIKTKDKEKINEMFSKICYLKSLENNLLNRRKIERAYLRFYTELFVKEIVYIEFTGVEDFNKAVNKCFINGLKFKRLFATNGGVKKRVVIFVAEHVYKNLCHKIDNGRNLTKPFVPAKLEAYKALVSSSSKPVSYPNKVIVVKDCTTVFKDDIILLDDTEADLPKLTYEKDYSIELNESDGYGLMSKELADKWSKEIHLNYSMSGCCLRNSFCKGMVFTFPYTEFAEEENDEQYIVKDAWGFEHDIREVDLILTTSMLKLWDSYSSMDDYLKNCHQNGYTFAITKPTPMILDDVRDLNYQFLQSYELTDEDIDELIKPTVNKIKDICGKNYYKTLLYLKGMNFGKNKTLFLKPDISDCLLLEETFINDNFLRNMIHSLIKKTIMEAKKGVLMVDGNFSVISGDPYSLCQSIFSLKVTGLLKRGEFYSKHWNDKKVSEVVCFRAPMTCHNNILKLNLANNAEVGKWYRYMKTVTIFNSWDCSTHALNGADKDGDQVFTTNNPILLKNKKETLPILCIQKTADKKIVTEEDLIKSNKQGFGDEIGSTTNRITAMIDIAASFSKDSEEYKELQYRIICGQNYQQNAIDKMKGIIAKPMPKYWYDRSSAYTTNNPINTKIVANKKPFFFIYNYPDEMKKFIKFKKEAKIYKTIVYGDLTDEEVEDPKYKELYDRNSPVLMNNSVMNRICWKVSKELDGVKYIENDIANFDYTVLKSPDYEYSKNEYIVVKRLLAQLIESFKDLKNYARNDEKKMQKIIALEIFSQRILSSCSNEKILCNILLDIAYQDKPSLHKKTIVWKLCLNTILDNLMQKKSKVNIPIPSSVKDSEDEEKMEFCGKSFTIKERGI